MWDIDLVSKRVMQYSEASRSLYMDYLGMAFDGYNLTWNSINSIDPKIVTTYRVGRSNGAYTEVSRNTTSGQLIDYSDGLCARISPQPLNKPVF